MQRIRLLAKRLIIAAPTLMLNRMIIKNILGLIARRAQMTPAQMTRAQMAPAQMTPRIYLKVRSITITRQTV